MCFAYDHAVRDLILYAARARLSGGHSLPAILPIGNVRSWWLARVRGHAGTRAQVPALRYGQAARAPNLQCGRGIKLLIAAKSVRDLMVFP